MKNFIFHTQDLCLCTNLRCPEKRAGMEKFMTKRERIEKEISKTKEQIAAMQAKLKDLEEQRKMAETAEKMQMIEKHKISSEQLQLLIQPSEDELRQLLLEKEKEKEQSRHEEKIIH